MKKIVIYSIICLSVLTGCKKDKEVEDSTQEDGATRTVLMYLFQDTNLSESLTDNINELEFAWDPEIDGTMLVYVDPSTRMTQFGGKPVLLEITHDETNLIVSKIVKVYEDFDAADASVFRKVQEDAIAMYSADSYGLIISGHGNGFFVADDPKTYGLGSSDRWGRNLLDIDIIADNTPVHYDFIILDACLMGETTTLYELRNATDYVVASVELAPGSGFAYSSDLKALFTQPYADLYTFARATANYYENEPNGKLEVGPDDYMTIGVYRMSAMDNLAVVTNKAIKKLDLSYDELRQSVTEFIDPTFGVSNSMYYPRDISTASPSVMYYDMGLLVGLLEISNEKDLAKELNSAIFAVVMQKQVAMSEGFRQNNPRYFEISANMSFFIPNKLDPEIAGQSNAFYNRFEWSKASGFTTQWE